MDLRMLYVTSKHGLGNKIQILLFIIQFISDSSTANAKTNSMKAVGCMTTIVSRDFWVSYNNLHLYCEVETSR